MMGRATIQSHDLYIKERRVLMERERAHEKEPIYGVRPRTSTQILMGTSQSTSIGQRLKVSLLTSTGFN